MLLGWGRIFGQASRQHKLRPEPDADIKGFHHVLRLRLINIAEQLFYKAELLRLNQLLELLGDVSPV